MHGKLGTNHQHTERRAAAGVAGKALLALFGDHRIFVTEGTAELDTMCTHTTCRPDM